MIKLIFFIVIFYIGYKVWKAAKTVNETLARKVAGQGRGEIGEDMVKDPYCNVYFQKSNGVHARVGDRDLYFCSEECRDKYLADRT